MGTATYTDPTPLVLVAGGADGEQRDQISDVATGLRVEFASSVAEFGTRIADADALAAPPKEITADVLGSAGRVRWIHIWAAGADEALSPEMTAHPAVLTCSKGNGAIPLAEHAIMLMLMLNRDAVRWVRAQDDRVWDQYQHGELNGLTCGIIGLGFSGQDVARKAKAFHMTVLGMRRSDRPVADVDEMFPRERLHEMLARCDVVVVAAPLTPLTADMFGEAEFRAMKPSATFICFSRGGIADDAALARALEEHWIAGAGLDAHGQEPLPVDSPFWTTPNTIITPHAGADTEGTRQRAVDIFVGNLQRFAAGRALDNVVDRQAGY